MDTTIEQQAAIDEALVPRAQRDMLHICPRVHGQFFDEPSLKRRFLPLFVFLDTVQLSGHSLMLTSTNYISHGDPLQPSSIKLTNEAIRNSNAYKEYYAIGTGAAPPKPKASVRRTISSSDTSITPPTAATSPRLTAFAKGKQTAKASKAKSQSALSEVAMTEAQQLKLVTKRSMQQTRIS
nr:hypothetical protein [Tanacetum cinerariifolium]